MPTVRAATYFNPRPPRGGRRFRLISTASPSIFQSTPPARGATIQNHMRSGFFYISIHAPREGGDRDPVNLHRPPSDFNPRPPRGGRRFRTICGQGFFIFQSTPPARGATPRPPDVETLSPKISIHAPREGGDLVFLEIFHSSTDFNPRPPRGGRQQRCTVLPADL